MSIMKSSILIPVLLVVIVIVGIVAVLGFTNFSNNDIVDEQISINPKKQASIAPALYKINTECEWVEFFMNPNNNVETRFSIFTEYKDQTMSKYLARGGSVDLLFDDSFTTAAQESRSLVGEIYVEFLIEKYQINPKLTNLVMYLANPGMSYNLLDYEISDLNCNLYFGDYPENWWTQRGQDGDLATYEILIWNSVRSFDGLVSDSHLNPDGSWTWKVERQDTASVLNSDGTQAINSDNTAKFKDVTAIAEAIVKPDGSGNFTLTHSYTGASNAYKIEGIMNNNGSWIITTHMMDETVFEAVGNFDDDWTGILHSNNNFEKRFINSDGMLTVITLTGYKNMQKTCIVDIDGLWTCEEENIVGEDINGNFCIKDIAIYKSRSAITC